MSRRIRPPSTPQYLLQQSVEAYIARQKEHHQRQDFQSEFLELLRRNGIKFDERNVFL